MSFQVTLRAARVNRGMKQADAARSIGVSSRTIYNWEIGKRFPPADKLLSLCDLYGVPMDNIFIPSLHRIYPPLPHQHTPIYTNTQSRKGEST